MSAMNRGLLATRSSGAAWRRTAAHIAGVRPNCAPKAERDPRAFSMSSWTDFGRASAKRKVAPPLVVTVPSPIRVRRDFASTGRRGGRRAKRVACAPRIVSEQATRGGNCDGRRLRLADADNRCLVAEDEQPEIEHAIFNGGRHLPDPRAPDGPDRTRRSKVTARATRSADRPHSLVGRGPQRVVLRRPPLIA